MIFKFFKGSFDINEYEAPLRDLSAETRTFVSIIIFNVVLYVIPKLDICQSFFLGDWWIR